jgi:hypothetical protein
MFVTKAINLVTLSMNKERAWDEMALAWLQPRRVTPV